MLDLTKVATLVDQTVASTEKLSVVLWAALMVGPKEALMEVM